MKKQFFTKLLAAVLIFSFSTSSASNNFWSVFEGKQTPSKLPMSSNVDNYSVFSLQQNGMKSFLNQLSANPDKAVEILLPDPENNFRKFLIWSTPMLESELAQKFPEIQTFTAYAEDNQNVTAKLDFTPYGFRALVFDGSHTYMINPYSEEADGYYVAFYKKDLHSLSTVEGCFVDGFDNLNISGLETNLLKNQARQNGSQRKTYRLAISTTGEYAVQVAGAAPTQALVLSKVVSTMNRVNGVYERELSISFNLINNNESIVFTDAASDPYNCNLDLECLIEEVQEVIDNTVGTANYDIGHVFCTAGGGLAALNATCNEVVKARGASTSANPDDYHVIIHEMGHQLGANHTFSANTGGCLDNGEPENAYEPGSGSTIMSYGGLCNPNNVIDQSDDYFGVYSLIEITTFLTNQGSICGSSITGSTPVHFEDEPEVYYIPKNTPFEITGPEATSVHQNAEITYNWEQYDLGNFDQTEAQNGQATSGPIFKSAIPTDNRTRIFPPLEFILDDTYSDVGERLPNVARTINLKYTARDIFQGMGTFKLMDSVMKIEVANLDQFRVTSPSSEETWNPGEQKTITWDVGGSTEDPINCGFVNIYLSLDNGETFPFIIVSNTANTGSYSYTVPDIGTAEGRIKIKGTGSIFFDIGKGKLNITGDPTNKINDKELADNISIYPNPATDKIYIQNGNMESGELNVVVYNILGQKIFNSKMTNELSISTTKWSRGNYIIHLIEERTGNISTHKVVLK